MKKAILSSFLTIALVAGSVAQSSSNRFIEKYQDNDEFSTVVVTKKMFQMIARIGVKSDDEDFEKISELSKSIDGLKVLSTEQGGRALFDEAKTSLKSDKFEDLMTIKDGSERVQIMVKDSGDGQYIDELLLIQNDEDEFTMLAIYGDKIDLDKIADLASKVDIDGMEKLQNLKDR